MQSLKVRKPPALIQARLTLSKRRGVGKIIIRRGLVTEPLRYYDAQLDLREIGLANRKVYRVIKLDRSWGRKDARGSSPHRPYLPGGTPVYGLKRVQERVREDIMTAHLRDQISHEFFHRMDGI